MRSSGLPTAAAATRGRLPPAASSGLKATAQRRSEEIAKDPNLQGRRAAAWLRMWDKANRIGRCHILEAFLSLHSRSTTDAVTQDLGDAAPLFFTRITSWLQLTYCKLQPAQQSQEAAAKPRSVKPAPAEDGAGAENAAASPASSSPLLLMVQSLAVFLRGATYVTQLVESGMAATLTDCLERGSSFEGQGTYEPLTCDEKMSILLLLLYVANAGRVYREMLWTEEGLLSLLRVLRAEQNEAVAQLLTELFVLLGRGNPALAPLVQCGLFRFIMSHYDQAHGQERAEQPNTVAGATAGAKGLSPSPPCAVNGPGGKDDTVVVLYAVRTLRGMQAIKETHHYSTCQNLHDPQPTQPTPRDGRGGHRVDDYLSSDAAPELDDMPVVCHHTDAVVSSFHGSDDGVDFYAKHPLFQPISTKDFLNSLFDLTLDDNTRFRVEGSELLVMAGKNIELLPKILNRALDVLDDDMLVIADSEDAAAVSRRHRRQLSCGRVAVQLMLTAPSTLYRRRTIIDLIALRSAHMTLLKYLRLTDLGDTAAVIDCCRALQVIARASDEEQRARLQHGQGTGGNYGESSSRVTHSTGAGAAAPVTAVLKMGYVIRDSLGASLYQVLLHEAITEEESFAMLRAARSSAAPTGVW